MNQEDKYDAALVAGRFKGRYRKCGKFGHKSAQGCTAININNQRQNNDKENGKFNRKYFLCGKYGHCKIDC